MDQAMKDDITSEHDNVIQKTIDLVIPQMGEGLQEVKIVCFLKQPGTWINEEELIYEMETDKSVVEIESSYSGKLIRWLAKEGDILAVGAVVGQLEVTVSNKDESINSTQKNNSIALSALEQSKDLSLHSKLSAIPPRTRAYCKTQGIAAEIMVQIPTSGRKLMPHDVDAYLKKPVNYREFVLSSQQQLLIERFKRSQQQLIAATLVSRLVVDDVNSATQLLTAKHFLAKEQSFISVFQTFAYIVAQVCAQHPRFRSVLMGDYKIREYAHVNIGIAVHTQTEDLTTAVIPSADKLNFTDFITEMQERVHSARQGHDQVKQAPHILLTYLGNNHIISGAPLLVEPAVAIIFLGASYRSENKLLADLSLTFDHRVMNGMEAAFFLQAITDYVKTLLISTEKKDTLPHSQQQIANAQGFQDWFLNEVSLLLGREVSTIDCEDSLGTQGMDSIKALKLVKSLENYFQENLSPTLVWHYPSCTALMNYLTQRFSLKQNVPPQQNNNERINKNADEIMSTIKKLSLKELNELLQEMEDIK